MKRADAALPAVWGHESDFRFILLAFAHPNDTLRPLVLEPMNQHTRIVALLVLAWLLSPGRVTAQSLVPSHLDRIGNSVAVRFDTVPGMTYRVEHSASPDSNPLNNPVWTPYPDVIYGLGQTARYHVYDAPAPNTQTVPHPANTPYPAEEFFFMLTAFDDGSAVATWTGSDDAPAKAYLPSFDLVYQGSVM